MYFITNSFATRFSARETPARAYAILVNRLVVRNMSEEYPLLDSVSLEDSSTEPETSTEDNDEPGQQEMERILIVRLGR